jgi:restriction system protein
MTSDEAFEFLLHDGNKILKTIQDQGAAQMGQGNLAEARRALEQAEQIKAMVATINNLKNTWKELVLQVMPVNSIQPIVIKPKPEIHPGRKNLGRLDIGQKTPLADFYIPILRTLVEMGGRGRVNQVLDRVGKMMEYKLNDYDRMTLKGSHALRWRNTAQWARFDLKEKGYLSANSPNGIWEITPAGRAYLENNQGKK